MFAGHEACSDSYRDVGCVGAAMCAMCAVNLRARLLSPPPDPPLISVFSNLHLSAQLQAKNIVKCTMLFVVEGIYAPGGGKGAVGGLEIW